MTRLRLKLPEVALSLASAAAFFGIAEAGLRLAGYVPEPALPGPMYVRSATRGHDLKPGYRGEGERSPYLVHPPIAINSLGMRGPEIDRRRRPGSFRILCLGDSYIFGWGLRPEEAFAARLESLLNARAPAGIGAEALNAGVPAYDSGQELQQLREKGLALQPDLVVLGFVLNDALPGGDRKPRLNIPFEGALKRLALYRFLGRIYQQGLLAAVAEARPREGGLLDIVAYEKANTRTLESGRPEVEEARRKVVRQISSMSRECRLRSIPFLVVIFPNRYQVEDPGYGRARFNQTLAAELAAGGIEAIDLFPLFKEAAARRPLYLPDTHPNAEGHEIAARAAAARIVEKETGR